MLYLLHGYTDDETAWAQFGQVKTIVDKHSNNPKISPMIIVMPNAGETWYINTFEGKTRYEDFFIEELIPFIDQTYRTHPKKGITAVSGLSMGGFGSLLYALKHPDLFSASAPLSTAVFTQKEWTKMKANQWNQTFGELFGNGLLGKERLTSHYAANSPLLWIQGRSTEDLNKVKYYIDCGDKDFLIKGNMELHSLLIDKGVPHEFRVRKGDHSWSYLEVSFTGGIRICESKLPPVVCIFSFSIKMKMDIALVKGLLLYLHSHLGISYGEVGEWLKPAVC